MRRLQPPGGKRGDSEQDEGSPSTGLSLAYGPFRQPGIYRVQLAVFDAADNSAKSTEYFAVSPDP